MSEKELKELSKPIDIKERYVFHSTILYGFGDILRKMTYYYPSFLPICSYFEHSSPPFYDKMWHLEFDFLTDIFFHRKDFATQWNNQFKGKARVFLSPFVWYKNKHNIKISKKAKGSVFFVFHSREGVERVTDKERLLTFVENLDEKFKPVTFCLYYQDILNNSHQDFLKKGFNVVTVGNSHSKDFIKNFYNMMKNFEYCLTNSIGGHVLFATNFNMPVSYIESLEPIHKTNSEDHESGRIRLLNSKTYKNAKKIFAGMNTEVTEKQLTFSNNMLGVYDHTSKLEMTKVFYISLFKYLVYKVFKALKQKFK